ncbi:MAE_28990/MAE_18760 family HEPN-like nuclease [Pantoea ananatis]
MDCVQIYTKRFDEIRLLALMAEDNSKPGGDIVALNAITRSGLVLLTGYFEGFIREMSKEFVEEVNDASLSPSKIPLKMLSEHTLSCTDKIKQNKIQEFSNLILSIESAQPIVIDSVKLSATNANPNVDTIERIFSNFDMPLILDELSVSDYGLDSMYNFESQVNESLKLKLLNVVEGESSKNEEIISLIESKWAAKKKRRRIGYLGAIDELFKKRNRIAHGEGFDEVTPQELWDAADAMENLCKGLTTKLTIKLNNLTP